MANTMIRLIFGDASLGVAGEHFHYLFSYDRGGLESLVHDGKEWLYRVPMPTFWRATTDNDRGNHFSQRAAMWLGADLFSQCQQIEVAVAGKAIPFPIAPINNRYSDHEMATDVQLTFTYRTPTVPATTVAVTYDINSVGDIHVTAHFQGQAGLPELPVFGMRFVMPTPAIGYDYTGLSGETYPDRMAGGRPGDYHVDVLPVTPYLVPQENGMHMATKAVTITRTTTLNNADSDDQPFQLRFQQGQAPFAFACLPYTALELENATHQEELPAIRRTVLTINGAVRGVGGIDSWGADVADEAHVAGDQDHEVEFWIRGPQSAQK